MAGKKPNASAVKALQKELKELNDHPVEGFKVMVSEEENLFSWDVAIFGPPMTLYEGGYFKAKLLFPDDYPYSPPSMHFVSEMFHPNIYENGEVCISILHSPGDDPQSGELPSERWNPTQNVRTILLSVISMLNEPNINSAAHVDASVAYRKWKDSDGLENEYERMVKSLVQLTHADAEKDGVSVPITVEEYCTTGLSGSKTQHRPSGDSEHVLDCDDNDEYYGFGMDDDDDDEVGDDDDDDDGLFDSCKSNAKNLLTNQNYVPDGVDSAMEELESERFSATNSFEKSRILEKDNVRKL